MDESFYQVDADYRMPPVKHGQIVAWFPNASPTEKPQVAYVNRVGARNVTVLTAVSGVKESVRHITDPKLSLNVDQRETGAWDYTAAEKELDARLVKLEARLVAVEMAIADPEESYESLRNRAIAVGVEFKGRPARSWLEDQINLKSA